MVKELCEAYLEQNKYCDKLQYLSKYDERLSIELLHSWVKLMNIKQELAKELCGNKD